MSKVKAQYCYHETQTTNGWRFTYRRSRYGLGFATSLFPIVFIIVIISTFSGESDAGRNLPLHEVIQNMTIESILIIGFITILLNVLTRKSGVVELTKDELIIGLRRYARKDISAFWVKGMIGEQKHFVPTHGGLIVGYGLTGAVVYGASAVTSATTGILNLVVFGVNDVNQKVMFQYGEKKVKLAGGLKEKSATALLKAILEKA